MRRRAITDAASVGETARTIDCAAGLTVDSDWNGNQDIFRKPLSDGPEEQLTSANSDI